MPNIVTSIFKPNTYSMTSDDAEKYHSKALDYPITEQTLRYKRNILVLSIIIVASAIESVSYSIPFIKAGINIEHAEIVESFFVTMLIYQSSVFTVLLFSNIIEWNTKRRVIEILYFQEIINILQNQVEAIDSTINKLSEKYKLEWMGVADSIKKHTDPSSDHLAEVYAHKLVENQENLIRRSENELTSATRNIDTQINHYLENCKKFKHGFNILNTSDKVRLVFLDILIPELLIILAIYKGEPCTLFIKSLFS